MNAYRSGGPLLVAMVALLTACAGRGDPSAGMPNPASAHCGQLGGETEIRTDPDGGQYGVCRLPDSRVCEEWTLFREGKCESRESPG